MSPLSADEASQLLADYDMAGLTPLVTELPERTRTLATGEYNRLRGIIYTYLTREPDDRRLQLLRDEVSADRMSATQVVALLDEWLDT